VPVVERAPAKLNLSLEVIGRRPDGYHDLVTVFQTIDLADELTFEPADRLILECDDPALAGDDNLVLGAARALAADRGARIRLCKRIPVAAGLGGGSADAAAALRGLVRLWGLRITEGTLLGLAATLGADVPFMLRGGTALAEGIGERVEALPELEPGWVVVHTPEAGPTDKTTRAYRALRSEHMTDGSFTRLLAKRIHAGASLPLAEAPNTFEGVADELFPTLAAARGGLAAAGAPWVRLTGAGPTLFTLVSDRSEAERIAATIAAPDRTWCVPTLPRFG
jgi:4-diphosphocytidyl-2-C-methyl-D-erythritol kinase